MRIQIVESPEETARRLREADALTEAGWKIARLLHNLAWHSKPLGPVNLPAPMFITQAIGLQSDPDLAARLAAMLTTAR